jgi:hypothetical protein
MSQSGEQQFIRVSGGRPLLRRWRCSHGFVALPASSAPMRRLYPLRLEIGFAPETRTLSGRACCSAAAISCRRVGGAIRPLRQLTDQNSRFGSGAADPVASADRPLSLTLQASCRTAANRRFGPSPDIRCNRENTRLLDYLVSASGQCRCQGEVHRLGGFEVDHQFERGRELHRKIGHLGPAKQAINIRRSTIK